MHSSACKAPAGNRRASSKGHCKNYSVVYNTTRYTHFFHKDIGTHTRFSQKARTAQETGEAFRVDGTWRHKKERGKVAAASFPAGAGFPESSFPRTGLSFCIHRTLDSTTVRGLHGSSSYPYTRLRKGSVNSQRDLRLPAKVNSPKLRRSWCFCSLDAERTQVDRQKDQNGGAGWMGLDSA